MGETDDHIVPTGFDLPIQWLISTGKSDNMLNPDWMDSQIVIALKSPDYRSKIIKDISDGDGLLAYALRDSLTSIGLPSNASLQAVRDLTRTRTFDYWETLIQTPQSLRPLRLYLMTAPAGIDGILKSISGWTGKEPASISSITLIAALKSSGIDVSSPPGPIDLQWDYTKRLASLPIGGANSAIRSNSDPSRFWPSFWTAVQQRISVDQSLQKEVNARIAAYSVPFEMEQTIFARILKSDSGFAFCQNLFLTDKESSLNPRSRIGRLWKAVATDVQGRLLEPNKNNLDAARQKLALEVEHSSSYTQAVMWFLTRPAEATSISLRLSICSAITSDENIVRLILDNASTLGNGWLSRFEESGEYAASPLAKTTVESFRSSYFSGRITSPQIIDFGRTLTSYLSRSDIAWSEIINNSDVLAISLSIAAIEREPALRSTLATALSASVLKKSSLSFEKYVSRNLSLSHNTYLQWLFALGSNSDKDSMLKFVAQFTGWLKSTGNNDFLTDIRIETSIPTSFRSLLIAEWMKDHDFFWKYMQIISDLPGSKFIRKRCAETLASMKADQMVATAISEWNLSTSDACDLVWSNLFSSTSSETLIDDISNASPEDSLGEIRSIAVCDLHARKLKPIITKFAENEGYDSAISFQVWVTTHPTQASRVHKFCMDNPNYKTEFTQTILKLVRFAGKGPQIMQHIQCKTELRDTWTIAFSNAAKKSPQFSRQIVLSLAKSRGGSLSWQSEVTKLERALMEIVASERTWWETLMVDPSGGLYNH